jgi:hypothetical protein
VVGGATLTTGQNGQVSSAYLLNGTSQYISVGSTFGLSTTNVTISCWVYNPVASNTGAFVKIGGLNGSGNGAGYGIGIGASYFDNGGPGPNIIMLYENVRWIATATALGTGWHHVAMVIDGSGIPYAYRDGVVVPGSYGGAGPQAPLNNTTTIGAAVAVQSRYFNGRVDDTRVYKRALSATEVASLFSAGAH